MGGMYDIFVHFGIHSADSPPTPFAAFFAAIAHFQRGDLAQAQASCRETLEADPGHDGALSLLGVIASQSGQQERAVDFLSQAIALNPQRADYHCNRGLALTDLHRLDEALASFDQAIRLQPRSHEALNNRGNVLQLLMRPADALASYDEAIRVKPGYAEAFFNRARALRTLNRLSASLADYDEALRLRPQHAQTHSCRGGLLLDLTRLEEALASYEHAIRLRPDDGWSQTIAAYIRNLLCQWEGEDRQRRILIEKVETGDGLVAAFALLARIDDPRLLRQAVERRSCQPAATPDAPAPPVRRAGKRRIHLAYLSADFRVHATTMLMAQVLELHDRERFELTGISFGPESGDPMRRRVGKAMDRFIDVQARRDSEVARLCQALGVDIAIDLKGHTAGNRWGILAERCAPIQVSWLGYPGTSGAAFMDYIVADRTVITQDDLAYYTEKVAWLPHAYQPNDRKREIAKAPVSRAGCGLPDQGFVFCCFNNNYKIQPATFDVWTRILKRVPDSVLWLLEDNPSASANLRREAASRGLHADRLVFAKRWRPPQHLARHPLADLFLDTWPCNAHTTASDALWAGLPVLTLHGRSFQGRVASSLLKAVGLPDLITCSADEYEALAVALAHDPQRLSQLRSRLAANRLKEPLFDCARFTRNLESAYTQMMERHLSGQVPDHLQVHDVYEPA